MSKIIVKGISLNGRISSPADKYCEPPPGPTHRDIGRTYNKVEEFLKSNGKPIIPEMINPLPLINEGIISGGAAASCYALNDCLIANQVRQYFRSTLHVIQVAAKLENESAIDQAFKLLKWEVWEMNKWEKYWRDFDKEKIVNVPEQLESITQLIPYFQNILTEQPS